MPTLIIFWQLILKTLEELTIVSSHILSLEMLIIRLVHIKDIPSYENILETIKKNNLKLIVKLHPQKNDHNEQIIKMIKSIDTEIQIFQTGSISDLCSVKKSYLIPLAVFNCSKSKSG